MKVVPIRKIMSKLIIDVQTYSMVNVKTFVSDLVYERADKELHMEIYLKLYHTKFLIVATLSVSKTKMIHQ